MWGAARDAAALATLPASRSTKLGVILGKVLPKALYGTPATPVATKPLAALASKVAGILDPGAGKHRSLAVMLALAWPKN
eukprot:2705664-Alexandrium_andersonii.AAC.1